MLVQAQGGAVGPMTIGPDNHRHVRQGQRRLTQSLPVRMKHLSGCRCCHAGCATAAKLVHQGHPAICNASSTVAIFQPRDDPQQGGFPDARRADKRFRPRKAPGERPLALAPAVLWGDCSRCSAASPQPDRTRHLVVLLRPPTVSSRPAPPSVSAFGLPPSHLLADAPGHLRETLISTLRTERRSWHSS
ncbi:hypothetical protein GQR58_030540 [Nymphon striatum]|nr:hypothetical protein GQR58_030540 [Nymphon striatum]